MPEYFFHIDVELFLDHDPPVDTTLNHLPQRPWDEGCKALAPFVKGSQSQQKRKSTTSQKLSDSYPNTPSKPCAQTPTTDFPHSSSDDQRLDHITVEGTDMADIRQVRDGHVSDDDLVTKGIGSGLNGLKTKGRYIPLDQKTTDSAWGIVHLYRDAEETPGLSDDALTPGSKGKRHGDGHSISDQDCTTLCILAVPSYLAPSDFLGFVGEETRDEVSHFRMIRTARANRYMVLMKFRNGKKAREWQKEWNGKVFNSMEPETCHVVFISSVSLSSTTPSTTFPSMKNDPFTSISSATTATKPLAPRTPSLIELPTCPVCLERMDETTGLLTIPCQHVFHCTCLEKWSGGGCPVCRYTHDDFSSRRAAAVGLNTDTSIDQLECETCHADHNLWQCLICGKIGCGRYDAAHAVQHYKETTHSFAMDMDSKRVWDYASDAYVHRIIQSTTGGAPGSSNGDKLVELPASRHQPSVLTPSLSLDPDSDSHDPIPRIKLDNLSLEYTHLLTSQLESQRVYFEDLIGQAADKASQASQLALTAQTTTSTLSSQLESLQKRYDDLAADSVPALEREKSRLETRASKFENLARSFEKHLSEEKTVSKRLMDRIDHLKTQVETLVTEKRKVEMEKKDLEEQNRDLSFFISSSEKVKGLDEDVREELKEGTVSVPDAPGGSGKKKGKGRGKK